MPHCTAAALAAILLAVKEFGLPEGDVSRDAFRHARDLQSKESTPYGPILEHMQLMGDGDVPMKVPVANPFALLWTAVTDCQSFRHFMFQKLQQKPPESADQLI